MITREEEEQNLTYCLHSNNELWSGFFKTAVLTKQNSEFLHVALPQEQWNNVYPIILEAAKREFQYHSILKQNAERVKALLKKQGLKLIMEFPDFYLPPSPAGPHVSLQAAMKRTKKISSSVSDTPITLKPGACKIVSAMNLGVASEWDSELFPVAWIVCEVSVVPNDTSKVVEQLFHNLDFNPHVSVVVVGFRTKS